MLEATAMPAGNMTEEMMMQHRMSGSAEGHFYVQTNEVRNAIIHYRRAANGVLEEIERVETGGAGSGTFKPISGQENAPNAFEGAGSVILAPDLRLLFTTNGGDKSVSSFGIRDEGRVTLLDVKPTGNVMGRSGTAKSPAYCPSRDTQLVLHSFGPDHVRLMSVDGPSRNSYMLREQRRLAAIVSADVAGYSQLMNRDESGTLAALKALRCEIVDPQIVSHRGRIVKTTGDGLLLEFSSVVDAVRCVVDVQTAIAERMASVPPARRVIFRVGVHLGDIIIDDDDLFGNEVNIAARLQEIAVPGGVCVSNRVHEDVRDRLDIAFEQGGAQALKNIARPVDVWRWLPGSFSPCRRAAVEPMDPVLTLPDKPSIAVLPFENMSGDAEQEYLADGITEDITTELARFRSLFVIARNSSFTYKGRPVDVRTVGREMGVRYVLQGSCRKASGRIRLTAQLIEALNGHHIWAERYDRDLHDIFVLQEELTRRIVAAIAPQVEAAELTLARRIRRPNLRSHELALRARAHATDALVSASRESRNAAIATAEAALQIDATCQLALTTLAWLHWQHVWFWTGPSTKDSLASAIDAANRAIALDPLDHEPRAHKSFCLTVAQEYDGALSEAHVAIELNPNASDALQALGAAQLISGSPEAAIESLFQALRLNPRDPAHFITYSYLSISYCLVGDHPKAVEWGLKSKHAAPSYAIGISALAQALAGDGRIDAACVEIETLRRVAPDYIQARLGGNSPFALPEHRKRQVRLLRLAAGEADVG